MRKVDRQIRQHNSRQQSRGSYGGTDGVARCFQEIDSSRLKVTVPKPTQVGGKKILRRARELSLRNSANYPRNFGRRGAGNRDYYPIEAKPGRREMAQATV